MINALKKAALWIGGILLGLFLLAVVVEIMEVANMTPEERAAYDAEHQAKAEARAAERRRKARAREVKKAAEKAAERERIAAEKAAEEAAERDRIAAEAERERRNMEILREYRQRERIEGLAERICSISNPYAAASAFGSVLQGMPQGEQTMLVLAISSECPAQMEMMASLAR
ncbi:MAG: hypothetical protein ISN29_07735 [Gammaproteobacteria bacterium AqS3]|nr:hypothetical protein [Gammaproteobacteria bacterium AqS3]